ncbi:hypothetical protein BZG36_05439 [Bifiguratus adelaidae]|uniref:Glucuronyl hydrolase n=1 Tax=Bifiguratus adelaidae TaxID=1938954 RepID=A0A261XTF0_9FUNG|nr:hypothetical protein BZG36_05439 [Bifiguratus adelaidae]
METQVEIQPRERLGLEERTSILSGKAIAEAFVGAKQHDYSEVISSVLGDAAVQKIWKVACAKPPKAGYFPHYVPTGTTDYVYEPSGWWTAGFFPGSVWLLYERSLKRRLSVTSEQLLQAGRKWEVDLEKEKYNTTTHDLGFMIMPAFYRDYVLTGNKHNREVVLQAAKSFATRWSEKVQCIRSWDSTSTKVYTYPSKETDFLVIIDNMMNLDLLYVASELSGNPKYARIATTHAETTLKHHIRPDNSTYHLIVYDPNSGAVKARLTHQGYAHESTWSRGQAWALYGYATVFKYTRDSKFLDASIRLTDYFLSRVGPDGVVYWDFDAPKPAPWDISAAMIACSGMLLLCELKPELRTMYLPRVFSMLEACTTGALSRGDSILDHATINNYEHSHNRLADSGLVYADYYFIEVGNRLIDMGLV